MATSTIRDVSSTGCLKRYTSCARWLRRFAICWHKYHQKGEIANLGASAQLSFIESAERQLHSKTVGERWVEVAFGEPIRPAQHGEKSLQAVTKGTLRHSLRQRRPRHYSAPPTAKGVELVLGHRRYARVCRNRQDRSSRMTHKHLPCREGLTVLRIRCRGR